MRTLRFVALSEEGTHLVLAADVPASIDNGERFLLPIDDRLRAAARGDMSRLGQIEIELESTLRPKDIQARIRAGETPEQVAAVAGIRVEKVLRYAYPVLQEREGIATSARQARVRLADGTPAAVFSEFLTERLALLDVDPRTALWDARRLPDGSWEVVVGWSAGPRSGATRWWYDANARSVTPADADTSAFAERSRSGQSAARAVRPADAPAAERPESDPTGAPVGAPESRKKASTPRPSPVGEPPERRAEQEQPPLIPLDPGPAPPAQDGERDTRARVPSWEDIVFGVRRKR